MRPTGSILGGVLVLALAVSFVCAQEATWEGAMAAGVLAYQQGLFPAAETHLAAALQMAEAFGPADPRLATSLNNLAALYYAQGRYAAAEPLNRRALAIRARALGPVHPDVATSLNNLAEVYRA